MIKKVRSYYAGEKVKAYYLSDNRTIQANSVCIVSTDSREDIAGVNVTLEPYVDLRKFRFWYISQLIQGPPDKKHTRKGANRLYLSLKKHGIISSLALRKYLETQRT